MKTSKPRIALTIFITVICLHFAAPASAQGYIEEDFLDVIEHNASFMLAEKTPAFSVSNTPAKWNNESAVIIGYSRNILFDRKSSGGFFTRRERSLYFFEKTRFRIKLNDNNAVSAFSEIYFRYGSKEDGFIARITKPGDTAVTIDLKNAVGVERGANIPEYFQSFFDQVANSGYQYYKVPVANLEPGDILEYVTTTKSKLDVTASGYIEFSPVYEVCNKEYPLLHNEITIETDEKSFFKSLALNGAPTFNKEPTAEKDFFRYVWTDKDRDTEKDINFVSPLLQYPLVKFQVIYSNSDEVKGALVGQKGELKSGFSKEELARKAWEDYELVSRTYFSDYLTVQGFIDQCYSELMKLGAKNLTEQQYTDQAYYLIRNKVLFMREYLSDKKFAYIFGSLLYQRDIKSELIISIGNNIGQFKDILFDQEIRYIIKSNNRFYFNCTDFSNPGELEESLLNNDAYIICQPDKKTKKQDIKPYTLPGTDAKDNTAEFTVNAELSADLKSIVVSRTSSYKGIQKAKASNNALKYTSYMFDDYKNYGGNDPSEKMKAKQAEEYSNSLRTVKDEYKKRKPEVVKEALQGEFEQRVENVRFTLVSDGRTQKKNTLTIREEFELPDFMRSAGKKYLVNLTGLTGSQLQIRKEQRNRKIDMDVRFPKTFVWNIRFKIPPGYTAEGLTELNQKIDNETGTFSTTAQEENGVVVVNIQKIYKARNIPSAKWADMLAFIDAAYNSSFKYILLKPKQ
jgi:hypothetical protein